MPRLPLIVTLSAFFSIFGFAFACPSAKSRIYYLNGSNGWINTQIDLEQKFIREDENVYKLHNCNSSESAVCFMSDILTFSSPPNSNGPVNAWTINGTRFYVDGLCHTELCSRATIDVLKIRSIQSGVLIDFYYNDACGLLGWTKNFSNKEETFFMLRPAPPKEGANSRGQATVLESPWASPRRPARMPMPSATSPTAGCAGHLWQRHRAQPDAEHP